MALGLRVWNRNMWGFPTVGGPPTFPINWDASFRGPHTNHGGRMRSVLGPPVYGDYRLGTLHSADSSFGGAHFLRHHFELV